MQPKNTIEVEFAFHPEMNRTVRVRTDGRIGIPRKNDISVAGNIAEEVKKDLTSVYADLLRDAEITVTIRQFNTKMEELLRAMSQPTDGQAKLVTILPDGQISLPLVQDMGAEGLTVPEVAQCQ